MFKKTLTSLLLTLIGVGGFLWVSTQELDNKWVSYVWIISIGIDSAWADDCTVWVDAGCANPLSGVQQKETWKNQDAEIQKMLNTLVAAVNVMLGIVTIIVTPAIMLASWLMSPDWTAGDLFGIRPVMHSLWVTVSNITYLIYAILLIFIALATIFNSEHYGYKSMLPRLALGIILVPLTWWMVQFTVSLATYVTAAAVSVPAEALQKYTSDNTWWNTPMIPKKMSYKNGEAVDDNNNKIDNEYCKTASNCLKPSEVTMNAWGLYSPLLIYSFWVFKIQDIKKIDNASDVIKSIMQLINQWIIGVLMFLVFGILIMWLIFMLLMRAIKLWFYAIFSPLFTIKYVLGEKAFWDADKDGSFNITEFIWLAFVPAVVSLALSFGLIIIAGMTSPAPNDPNNKCEWEVCTITIMGNPQNTIVSSTKENISSTVVSMGWISYTFEWKTQWWAVVVPTLSSALSLTGNFFWTIILDIIALIFIWIAFMAGKGVNKAAGKAIEPFENMGNQIGKLGMSLPKYAPIPGTGGLSMKSMERVPTSISDAIAKNDSANFENSKLWKILHAEANIPPDSIKKITEAIKGWKKEEFKEAWKNNLPFVDRPNAHNSWIVEEFMEQVKKDPKYLEQIGVDDPAMRTKIKEFEQKDLHHEATRKELLGLMKNAFWSMQKWGADGKQANNSWGFTIKEALDDKDKNTLIIDLGWISVTAKKDGTGITQTDKDRLKDKVWTWTQSEFEENMRKGWISNSEAINKVVKDLQLIEKDWKKFFKPEEKKEWK